ncbi:hypothetical protein Pgy4_20601, partial [Pseudomonas savastanoi pv. glycinea str. race 4]
ETITNFSKLKFAPDGPIKAVMRFMHCLTFIYHVDWRYFI